MPAAKAPPSPAPRGASASKGGGKSGMNPMVAGILIGLLLGLLIALIIAVWLNRKGPTNYVDKTSAPPLPAPVKASPAKDASTGAPPKYEFYKLLPGESSQSPAAPSKQAAPVTTATPQAPTNATPPAPVVQAAPAVPAKAEVARIEPTYLQVGAFQQPGDAENLKAKLAFAGLEANVSAVNVSGKGTLYRVRLGPFKTSDELNRAKAALSQNGVAANITKAD